MYFILATVTDCETDAVCSTRKNGNILRIRNKKKRTATHQSKLIMVLHNYPVMNLVALIVNLMLSTLLVLSISF